MFVAIKTSESESSSLHQHFPLLWKAQNSSVGYDNDNYSKGRGNFFYQDLSKPLQSFKGSRDRMTYWILEFEPWQSLVMHCFFLHLCYSGQVFTMYPNCVGGLPTCEADSLQVSTVWLGLLSSHHFIFLHQSFFRPFISPIPTPISPFKFSLIVFFHLLLDIRV